MAKIKQTKSTNKDNDNMKIEIELNKEQITALKNIAIKDSSNDINQTAKKLLLEILANNWR